MSFNTYATMKSYLRGSKSLPSSSSSSNNDGQDDLDVDQAATAAADVVPVPRMPLHLLVTRSLYPLRFSAQEVLIHKRRSMGSNCKAVALYSPNKEPWAPSDDAHHYHEYEYEYVYPKEFLETLSFLEPTCLAQTAPATAVATVPMISSGSTLLKTLNKTQSLAVLILAVLLACDYFVWRKRRQRSRRRKSRRRRGSIEVEIAGGPFGHLKLVHTEDEEDEECLSSQSSFGSIPRAIALSPSDHSLGSHDLNAAAYHHCSTKRPISFSDQDAENCLVSRFSLSSLKEEDMHLEEQVVLEEEEAQELKALRELAMIENGYYNIYAGGGDSRRFSQLTLQSWAEEEQDTTTTTKEEQAQMLYHDDSSLTCSEEGSSSAKQDHAPLMIESTDAIPYGPARATTALDFASTHSPPKTIERIPRSLPLPSSYSTEVSWVRHYSIPQVSKEDMLQSEAALLPMLEAIQSNHQDPALLTLPRLGHSPPVSMEIPKSIAVVAGNPKPVLGPTVPPPIMLGPQAPQGPVSMASAVSIPPLSMDHNALAPRRLSYQECSLAVPQSRPSMVGPQVPHISSGVEVNPSMLLSMDQTDMVPMRRPSYQETALTVSHHVSGRSMVATQLPQLSAALESDPSMILSIDHKAFAPWRRLSYHESTQGRFVQQAARGSSFALEMGSSAMPSVDHTPRRRLSYQESALAEHPSMVAQQAARVALGLESDPSMLLSYDPETFAPSRRLSYQESELAIHPSSPALPQGSSSLETSDPSMAPAIRQEVTVPRHLSYLEPSPVVHPPSPSSPQVPASLEGGGLSMAMAVSGEAVAPKCLSYQESALAIHPPSPSLTQVSSSFESDPSMAPAISQEALAPMDPSHQESALVVHQSSVSHPDVPSLTPKEFSAMVSSFKKQRQRRSSLPEIASSESQEMTTLAAAKPRRASYQELEHRYWSLKKYFKGKPSRRRSSMAAADLLASYSEAQGSFQGSDTISMLSDSVAEGRENSLVAGSPPETPTSRRRSVRFSARPSVLLLGTTKEEDDTSLNEEDQRESPTSVATMLLEGGRDGHHYDGNESLTEVSLRLDDVYDAAHDYGDDLLSLPSHATTRSSMMTVATNTDVMNMSYMLLGSLQYFDGDDLEGQDVTLDDARLDLERPRIEVDHKCLSSSHRRKLKNCRLLVRVVLGSRRKDYKTSVACFEAIDIVTSFRKDLHHSVQELSRGQQVLADTKEQWSKLWCRHDDAPVLTFPRLNLDKELDGYEYCALLMRKLCHRLQPGMEHQMVPCTYTEVGSLPQAESDEDVSLFLGMIGDMPVSLPLTFADSDRYRRTRLTPYEQDQHYPLSLQDALRVVRAVLGPSHKRVSSQECLRAIQMYGLLKIRAKELTEQLEAQRTVFQEVNLRLELLLDALEAVTEGSGDETKRNIRTTIATQARRIGELLGA